jgi:hypothetical protein
MIRNIVFGAVVGFLVLVYFKARRKHDDKSN